MQYNELFHNNYLNYVLSFPPNLLSRTPLVYLLIFSLTKVAASFGVIIFLLLGLLVFQQRFLGKKFYLISNSFCNFKNGSIKHLPGFNYGCFHLNHPFKGKLYTENYNNDK